VGRVDKRTDDKLKSHDIIPLVASAGVDGIAVKDANVSPN
jgi:hypothetical protein